MFAGQSRHALVPSTILYLPGMHAEQLNMLPSYPKLHPHSKRPDTETELFGHDRHVLTFVACTAVEYVFVAHFEHEPVLISLLYVPDAHDVQSLRPLPPNPALHGHVAVLSNRILEPVAMACKSKAMSGSDVNVLMKYNPARSKFVVEEPSMDGGPRLPPSLKM
jgi:hypothetical protein